MTHLHNNEANKFCQEVTSIRRGFKPQTLLIRDKESNKEKVLQRWYEYYERHFALQDWMDSDGGEDWTMSVQIAEPYVEPPDDVDMEMAISNLKNR